MPNVRMVLLKGSDERGFVLYTNFESQKGREMLATPKAALCFHWKSLRRQVRLRGPVEVVSDQEADEYFMSRPRGSRIGLGIEESRPLESRFALEKASPNTRRGMRWRDSTSDYWSGFRIRHCRSNSARRPFAARPFEFAQRKRRTVLDESADATPDGKTLPPRLKLPGGQRAGTGCRNRAAVT